MATTVSHSEKGAIKEVKSQPYSRAKLAKRDSVTGQESVTTTPLEMESAKDTFQSMRHKSCISLALTPAPGNYPVPTTVGLSARL
jgi:hypothetical protein